MSQSHLKSSYFIAIKSVICDCCNFVSDNSITEPENMKKLGVEEMKNIKTSIGIHNFFFHSLAENVFSGSALYFTAHMIL